MNLGSISVGSSDPTKGAFDVLEVIGNPEKYKQALADFKKQQDDASTAIEAAKAAKAEAEAKAAEIAVAQQALSDAKAAFEADLNRRNGEFRNRAEAFEQSCSERSAELGQRAEDLAAERKAIAEARAKLTADTAEAQAALDAQVRAIEGEKQAAVTRTAELNQREATVRQAAADVQALYRDGERMRDELAQKLDTIRAFADSARDLAGKLA